MSKHFLLEIGLEELPARYIRQAVTQMEQKLTTWLQESRIDYGQSQVYATPRRIAVLIEDVASVQKDIREEVKGPSRKIALDEQGEWSKAALGFARSQGIAVEQLYFKSINSVEYVYAEKNSKGLPTKEVMEAALADLVLTMSFPKNMRWGHYDLKFARPIRWLVCLWGDEVIPLQLTNVRSDRITRGHRFLGKDIILQSAEEYNNKLKEQYVIADIDERQQRILTQIESLSNQKNWNIDVRSDLLEEVNFLVEYPTVLYGQFDPEFLEVPQEVLITSMREHQRYFPVLDQRGSLLPYFITVRNGNDVSLEQVARGNEKVLRARLADAVFFYNEDQKMSIEHYLNKLKTVVFHEELGTVADKTERIVRIALQLATACSADNETAADIKRTATICKFDLVTQMVYEFPELQGLMGEDYARKAGEKESVARAVFEHYLPRHAGESTPSSLVGAIVSIADKIDTIIGCFSIGIIPTGSQDPYGLRRQTAGIVQTMLEQQLPFTVADLINIAIRVHEEASLMKRGRELVMNEVTDFFGLRIKHLLSDKQIRYDVIDAVMAAGYADIVNVVDRAEVLMRAIQKPDVKLMVESFNRVDNLASKGQGNHYDPSLFSETAEHDLASAWQHVHTQFDEQLKQGKVVEALNTLGTLHEPIHQYFDSVMVMVDDEKLRQNRLALLINISEDIRKFADFHKIVWS